MRLQQTGGCWLLLPQDKTRKSDCNMISAKLWDEKLDGVGPDDNRPSTNQLYHFFQFFPQDTKKNEMWHVTGDTWQVKCDTWHVTHDKWHILWDEHSIKISSPHLYWFRIDSVLSIFPQTLSYPNQWRSCL